jgi:hypothetical protein
MDTDRSRLFSLILAYLHSAHPEGIHSALGRIHLVGMRKKAIPSLGQISVPGWKKEMMVWMSNWETHTGSWMAT